jgi:hypothetical protein
MAATGMLAALATTYVSAGLSKMVESGGAWAQTDTLRLMVLSHYEHGTTSALQALRHWIGHSPRFCQMLSLGTLVVQIGSPTLLGPPRARTAWALALVGFHAGIWLASEILFVQAIALACTIAIPWGLRAPTAEVAPTLADGVEPRILGRVLVSFWLVAIAVVALARLFGWGWR